MNTPVRLLHLEDDSADAELILAVLRGECAGCELHRVTNREDYVAALERGGFDLILADHRLPSFDGFTALTLARARRPSVPFLFVSGFIGEEAALDSLKNGATDYVFKHNLARLAPAIRRALQEAREQRERQQAEAALVARDAMQRSFYNAAPVMLGVVEALPDDLRHVNDNTATARFLGTTPEAMLGRRASELGLPPEAIQKWLEHLRLTRQNGRPVQFEMTVPRAGKPRCLTVTVSELPAIPGQPARYCYIADDITEKRELEQQFLRAQRLESLGTLASGLAHDLNNVLAPIMMALRLFRTKLTDPEDQELLTNLQSSARRGADIIRQVLTFARGAEGARQPLALNQLVNDLARMLRDTFPRAIEIQTRLPDDGWKVIGDATQIYQVLMNLCVNARDAMPDGGRLVITAENVVLDEAVTRSQPGARAGRYVILTVTDTGTGIASETLGKIFDPFFTTKEPGKGTGLGLSTVLTIVKSHGGFVTLTSRPGHGAEFKVHLPAEADTAFFKAEAATSHLERGHGEWILVVDDEVAIRKVTRATLEQQGYRVTTASDGAEALAEFSRRRSEIQLVITDMMMPVMGGAALVSALRSIDPQLKIVAVSGVLEAAPAGVPVEAPGMVFLPKPFTAEKLLQTVQSALIPPSAADSP